MGGTRARTQDSSFNHCIARRPGPGASGSCTDFCQYRRSTRLFVRLLWIFAIRLRTHGVLRVGIFLQRHLSGYGPMGRLGLWPRLGKPSLRQRWRRKVSRRSWPHSLPFGFRRRADESRRSGSCAHCSFPCRWGETRRSSCHIACSGFARLGSKRRWGTSPRQRRTRWRRSS